ncbi:DUF5994 family protein [Streptomyces sp. NPDC056161]|uniref:DUF5994 family protein n=1 Tax=Streptomyces sp. NPDC056161 TaxID=3345732 RepID=UPI0035DE791A
MWWPRSRDLTRELPLLTAALGDLWGRITRITVNPAYWPVIPRWVSVTGRTVHVGWSTEEQDPHRLTFFSTAGRRDVLVIPPETGADAGARLWPSTASMPRPRGKWPTASMPGSGKRRGRPTAEQVDRWPPWPISSTGHSPAGRWR